MSELPSWFTRSAGVLLHPTSLPGPYGIGDVGPSAHRWIDRLARTGTGLWQVLPLGPTGYGDSPYQTFSSFAGNPYLVSPAQLVADGFLDESDVAHPPGRPEAVEYGVVIPWKVRLLDRAWERARSRPDVVEAVERFTKAESGWLDDFALFMAIKDEFGGRPWYDWPPPLRDRDPRQLDKARERLAEPIARHVWRQYLFFSQWGAVRSAARAAGVRIIGDIPIFVAHDSADVWTRRDLFKVTPDGRLLAQAGVPPDYFSKTGQLWGNPVYDWDAHVREGFAWWTERVAATLRMADIIRIDHFRGFAAYWEVPADARTAERGRWVPSPGDALFSTLRERLGELPIIAEDLGFITPDVVALRERFGFPGMKIIEFAFDENEETDVVPHRIEEHAVVYTSTHDNDTLRGWWEALSEAARRHVLTYLDEHLPHRTGDVVEDLVELAWHTRARFALAPLQDLLGLGSEARMNRPGTASGNWRWRVTEAALTDDLDRRLRARNEETDRIG